MKFTELVDAINKIKRCIETMGQTLAFKIQQEKDGEKQKEKVELKINWISGINLTFSMSSLLLKKYK